MRRLYECVAVDTEITRADVIRDEEDEIRFVRGGETDARSAEKEGEEEVSHDA
jgi:hypothetical protein